MFRTLVYPKDSNNICDSWSLGKTLLLVSWMMLTRVKEDRPFLLTPATLRALAEAMCCARVFVQGVRGYISPVGSLSPYKNRGEHSCLEAQTHPKLVQTSQRPCPNHQPCSGDKAQERSPRRAAQSPLPSNPAPRTPFVTPIPSAPL